MKLDINDADSYWSAPFLRDLFEYLHFQIPLLIDVFLELSDVIKLTERKLRNGCSFNLGEGSFLMELK
jgi:hypothetical protein